MHLDEKTILLSLVELTDHLRAVVAETKVNCVTIAGVAQRWCRWPHFATAAGLRRAGRNVLGGGRGRQQPGARLTATRARLGSRDWPLPVRTCGRGPDAGRSRGPQGELGRPDAGLLGSGKRYYGAVEVSRSQPRNGTPNTALRQSLGSSSAQRGVPGSASACRAGRVICGIPSAGSSSQASRTCEERSKRIELSISRASYESWIACTRQPAARHPGTAPWRRSVGSAVTVAAP